MRKNKTSSLKKNVFRRRLKEMRYGCHIIYYSAITAAADDNANASDNDDDDNGNATDDDVDDNDNCINTFILKMMF